MLAIILAAAALSGCDNPKSASDEHFAKALNAYLAKNPACLPVSDFGDVRPDNTNNNAFPAYYMSKSMFGIDASMKQADALVSAGLLSEQDTTIQQKMAFGSGTQPVQVKEYDLTDAGRSLLAKPGGSTQRGFFGNGAQFCYGKPEVIKVEQYTEPAAIMGVTVSHVKYTYHLTDVASWARNPAIGETVPVVRQNLADQLEGSADLVLTNNGWVEQHEAMR